MTFEFADGTDIFWARAQVNERLQEIRDQLARRRRRRPRADRHAARRNADVHDRVGNAERAGNAQPRRLGDPSGAARPARRRRRQRARRLRAHVRGRAVRAGHGGARHHHAGARKRASSPTTATTAPAACAKARKRCWCAPRAASGRSTTSAISWSRRAARPSIRVADVADVRYRRHAAQRRRDRQCGARGGLGARCSACAAPTPRPSSTASRRKFEEIKPRLPEGTKIVDLL